MTTVTDSVVIKRRREQVFAYAANVLTFRDWGTGVEGASQTSGEGPGSGAQYEIQRRVGRRIFDVAITVAEFKPDELLVLDGASNGMPWRSEMRFDVTPEGTTATESIGSNRQAWRRHSRR